MRNNNINRITKLKKQAKDYIPWKLNTTKEHQKYHSLKKRYNVLRKNHHEMSGYLEELQEQQDIDRAELRYLYEFIRYKEQEEEYHYFCKHAYEI